MEEIESNLKNYLTSKNIEGQEINLSLAPENTGADFSTNLAMKLAKVLHQAPLEIANDIKESLKSPDYQIEVAPPGFLNFTMSETYFQTALENLQKSDFSLNIYNNQTLLTEFSDPNPFKVLHVGHLYTSVVGDAISRLLENAGGNVKRLNFGGDVGLHVAKNLYILRENPEAVAALQNATPAEKAELLGECYVKGTRAYEDDEKAHIRITRLNKLIYEICENGPEKSYEDVETAEIARLYWWGREASYAYFAEFYKNLGLKFDKYYPESAVASLGKAKVLENTPGTYEKSDGAIIFRGEKYGLHTRVFINKEGIPTYEAKDVGLIFKKDEDSHFDKSIVITGDEQKEYMKVVMKSVEQYAPSLIERSTHLTHGMVKLPGAVKMSSRRGNFIRAVDILQMIKDALKTEYHSEDEKIALGAIKYAFLKSKLGGDIELDIKETINMTGNSGPYLQYSAVRARKILEKEAKDAPVAAINSFEKTLIRKLANYKTVLNEATRELAPHKLATYLYDTAQEFSRFYENCPVAGSENENTRRKIVESYLKIITHGLNLLGIEVPERM